MTAFDSELKDLVQFWQSVNATDVHQQNEGGSFFFLGPAVLSLGFRSGCIGFRV